MLPQKRDQFRLQRIRILVFVDEDMLKRQAPAATLLQDPHGQLAEIGKIHQARGALPAAILAVDLLQDSGNPCSLHLKLRGIRTFTRLRPTWCNARHSHRLIEPKNLLMHARKADLFGPRARTGERLKKTQGRRRLGGIVSIEHFTDYVTELHFRLPSVHHLELRIYRGFQGLLPKKPGAETVDGRNPCAVIGLTLVPIGSRPPD